MANMEVVKFFRRKTNNGYDAPTYLGAEQRFVSGLRNSSVNNLEEQFLIGTDTYTEKYIDKDGNKVIETSYKINDGSQVNKGYYKIISIIYETGTENIDFFFDNDEVKFPRRDDEVTFGIAGNAKYPDVNALYGNIGTDMSAVPPKKIETLTFEDNDLKIFPSSFTIIKKDELHFINGANDLLVLTKTTERKYADNGTREVIRESIINHIA